MRSNFAEANIPFGTAASREIVRRSASSPDEIVGPVLFGQVAKLVWPFKTAFILAELGKTSQRSAERWLSGEHEPPPIIVAAMLTEIFKPRERVAVHSGAR
jgi:hypothetical protein